MPEELRAGIIGCDTSHCIAFTKVMNNADDKAHVPGVRVVEAYPSVSEDIPSSVGRVDGFKKELAEKWDIAIVESIEALLEQVDVVLLESVDGRRHLSELKPVAEARKPVFIDKPFAASLDDAKKMVELIDKHKLPCFSGSSLRFDSNIAALAADTKACGKILGCDAFSPAHLDETNPGLFWYGIHGVEILYTIMGEGCQSVQCTSGPDGELAVGTWKDGRIGTMRGIRKGKGGYGAMVLCENSPPINKQAAGDYYGRLVKAIVEFFKTGKPPLPISETLEICAFIDAALRSSNEQGCDVTLRL